MKISLPKFTKGSWRSVSLEERSARGVTIIEFGLAFPVLLFILLAIIDVVRYIAVEAILNKAASDAVQLASKISNYDIDIRGLTATDADYQSYAEARRRILVEATALPLQTLISDYTTPSTISLLPYIITDQALTTLPPDVPPSITTSALVLRPGESATRSDGTHIIHPTLSPAPDGLPPPQNTEVLLNSQPIYVEVRAQVEMFFPLFRDAVAVGTALGYREEVPKGPFGASGGSGPPGGGGTPTTGSSSSTTTTTTTSSTTTTWSCPWNWDECIRQTQGSPPGSGKCPIDNIDLTSSFCSCDFTCNLRL